MLDDEDPHTLHVFAAVRQEDLILEQSKRMTLADAPRRRVLLEAIRPAFAELRLLNKSQFGDSPEIAAGIDQFEREVQTLADLPLIVPSDREGSVLRCPACGGKPIAASRTDPIRHCRVCLHTIMGGLDRCDEGFGTDCI